MNNLLIIKDLIFAYGTKEVLNIPEVTFPADRITAVIGSNGSGKTTLLKIIGGLLPSGTGRIFYNGFSITGKREEILRKLCVLVHQNPYLFSGTVKKNMEIALYTRGMGRKAIDVKVEDLMHKFALGNLKDNKISKLSGGEKQKLALARAAGLNRKIFLLDEPQAHIDQNSKKMMEKILIALSDEGKHIIFTTHDYGFAYRMAGRIIHLENGRIKGVEDL